MPFTPWVEVMMSLICCSVCSPKDFSMSSSNGGLNIFTATTNIISPMTTAAMGSSIVHLSPRTIAPPMPMSEPMEEKASER